MNDTVVGDPLFTIPLNINATDGLTLNLNGKQPSLCYEIHGEANEYFNLVSDDCVSVNAHYIQLEGREYWNVIDQIAVRAVDSAGSCRDISVDLGTCLPTIDGVQFSSNFRENGVFVRVYRTHVRVSVPNCNRKTHLVMNVICQKNFSLIDPFTDEKFSANLIKFVISRGINLNNNSHGLVGEWYMSSTSHNSAMTGGNHYL